MSPRRAPPPPFWRPSIILSIGAIGGEEAKAFLEKYTVSAAKDESEKRHFAEETDALLSARRKLTKIAHHAFRALDTEYEFELRRSIDLDTPLDWMVAEAVVAQMQK